MMDNARLEGAQYNQGQQGAPSQQASTQSWGNAPQQAPAQQAAPQMAPAYQAPPQNMPTQRAPQQTPVPNNPATGQAVQPASQPPMDFDDDIPF